MSQNDGKWIKDDTIKQNHIRPDNDTFIRARNNADSADINIVKVNTSDLPEFGTQPQFNGTPSVDNDLVNRGYVLDVLQGLRDPKDACRVASTANINLGVGTLLNIDGIVVSAGDRILVKDQTLPAENGIYAAAVGAWTRTTDADADAEVTQGMSALIAEGLLNARKVYVLTTADPITVGVTGLNFAQAPNPANFLIPQTVKIAVDNTIETNGFFDLPHLVEDESICLTPLGGPEQDQGTDYTSAPNVGVTRITFAGDLAARVADGDDLLISYSYATS